MSKVIPFSTSHRGKSIPPDRPVTSVLEMLVAWFAFRRRRRSLGLIPEELLDDIVADEDARTWEKIRRVPTRFDAQTWF
ncbi:hypothetical protein [Labrenzia sp. DG1229]|uniref:hypothetical protein n=1 Tax=Labrenzia sp. DG1229 TaxID=681847 RepID=UPI000491EBF3|nr:hypothetical protein [Labrenzia sp. DG1229]